MHRAPRQRRRWLAAGRIRRPSGRNRRLFDPGGRVPGLPQLWKVRSRIDSAGRDLGKILDSILRSRRKTRRELPSDMRFRST